jgi:flavin-binding protein dodecin
VIVDHLFYNKERTGISMGDHVYKITEIVGSSTESIEDAIQKAVRKASQTLRNLRWIEVGQIRGHIENGSVRHYQVTVKIGFTMEATSE